MTVVEASYLPEPPKQDEPVDVIYRGRWRVRIEKLVSTEVKQEEYLVEVDGFKRLFIFRPFELMQYLAVMREVEQHILDGSFVFRTRIVVIETSGGEIYV